LHQWWDDIYANSLITALQEKYSRREKFTLLQKSLISDI